MPRHGEEDDAGDEPEHVPIALDSLISWRSGASGNWSRLSGAIGVPDDMRQSFAELREPDGRARAGRWLLVAVAYALAGVALWLAMLELYFGGAEMACSAALENDAEQAVHTVVGSLPILWRAILLLPVVWVCGKITGYSSDQPGLVRALLLGHGAGDGKAAAAGWEAWSPEPRAPPWAMLASRSRPGRRRWTRGK